MARRLPKSVVVAGQKWRVVLKPMAHRGLHGQCVYTTREIQVDSELPPDERTEVFLHELIHACLPETCWSPTAEERMVLRLSPRLLAALQGIGWAPGG